MRKLIASRLVGAVIFIILVLLLLSGCDNKKLTPTIKIDKETVTISKNNTLSTTGKIAATPTIGKSNTPSTTGKIAATPTIGKSNTPPTTDKVAATPTMKKSAATPMIDDSLTDRVGQRSSGASNQLPKVIVFEERHDSRVGQVEIAIMLNRLYEKLSVRELCLEGAEIEHEPPSATWFHPLPDEDVRSAVALQLLEQGEISAAEFIAMMKPDFHLHPSEKAAEHVIALSDNASIAPIGYLFAIASQSLTSEQIGKANELMGQKKQMEAIEYIINTNAWTKDRYVLVRQTNPAPQIEDMIELVDDLEAKAKETGADVGDYTEGLRELRAFYAARGAASTTMVGYALKIAKDNPNAPIVMDIGAAHTKGITTALQAEGLSNIVLSPLSLLSDDDSGSLYTQAYERKTQAVSIDPAGALGAYLDLDGRSKPPPVLNETWLQTKAKIMYAGIVIARAAASGGKPPYGLDKAKLGISDGMIDIDLSAFEVQEVVGKNGSKVHEVMFPVTTKEPAKTFWMKVCQVDPEALSESKEQTLEDALFAVLGRLKIEEEVDDKKALEIETKNSSSNPAITHPAVDVKAAFSDDRNAIAAVKLSG